MNDFDKDMSAVAFAEAGEHETAREMLSESEGKQKRIPHPVKKKPVAGMVIFGALSLSLYVGLMMRQDLVMDTFTRGGLYTAWPICTALVFSFIHGAFASNFLSVLGIEAKKH